MEFSKRTHWSHQTPSSNKIRDDYTWTTPDGQHQKLDWLYSLQPKMEKLYTISKNKSRSWLWVRSWTPYCLIQTEIEESMENHLTIQVWPKSNPLWSYRSDRVSEELWMEVHNIVQEVVTKTIPKENKWKNAKWLSEKASQIAEKREAKGKRERYT